MIKSSVVSDQEFELIQISCQEMIKEKEKKLVIKQRIGLIWSIVVLISSAFLFIIITYGVITGRFNLGVLVASIILLMSGFVMTYLSVFALREESYTKKYFLKKYLVSAIEYDEKFVKNTIYTWVFVDTICVLFKENKKVKLFILKQADNPEFYQKMKVDYSKKIQRPSTFQYIRYLYFEDQGIEGD